MATIRSKLLLSKPAYKRATRLVLISFCVISLSGCVGKIVGAVVDTTIEVAKVPFKVGGAVIDVASGDDDKEEKED